MASMVLDYSGRKTLKHTSNDPLPDAQKREMKVWSRKNISVNSNLENMFVFGTSRTDAFSACRLLFSSPGLVDRGMYISVSSCISTQPQLPKVLVGVPLGVFIHVYHTYCTPRDIDFHKLQPLPQGVRTGRCRDIMWGGRASDDG